MSTESKKHHYVPQATLRRFSINSNEKQIYVFDKLLDKSYISSIIDCGSENKYNTIITESGEINLEALYQDIDDLSPILIQKIVDNGSLEDITLEELILLAITIANQLKRTKLHRSTLDYIDKKINETLEEVSERLQIDPTKNTNKRHTTEEIKAASIISSFELEKEVKSLLNKAIYLIKNTSKIPFIISDNPVVMHNGFKYGGKGLNAKGIEIYFPINPRYTIVFCCKSIINKLEQANEYGILKPFGVAFLKSIWEDIPLELNNTEDIEFYNQQQVINSQRYLYSNNNDFTLVREIISKIPETKLKETSVFVGGLSKGSLPNPNLPMGDILVVYGSIDHNMLPIKIIDKLGAKIIFSCRESLLLQKILSDKPYEYIEVYSDQQQTRFIREPDIITVDEKKGIYELSHKDKAFNEIIVKLTKQKNARKY